MNKSVGEQRFLSVLINNESEAPRADLGAQKVLRKLLKKSLEHLIQNAL